MKSLPKTSNFFNTGSPSIKLLLNNKLHPPDAWILTIGDLNGDASVARFMKSRVHFMLMNHYAPVYLAIHTLT